MPAINIRHALRYFPARLPSISPIRIIQCEYWDAFEIKSKYGTPRLNSRVRCCGNSALYVPSNIIPPAKWSIQNDFQKQNWCFPLLRIDGGRFPLRARALSNQNIRKWNYEINFHVHTMQKCCCSPRTISISQSVNLMLLLLLRLLYVCQSPPGI